MQRGGQFTYTTRQFLLRERPQVGFNRDTNCPRPLLHSRPQWNSLSREMDKALFPERLEAQRVTFSPEQNLGSVTPMVAYLAASPASLQLSENPSAMVRCKDAGFLERTATRNRYARLPRSIQVESVALGERIATVENGEFT